MVYILSRLALINLNEAEFTDGYQLLTWSFDHPVRWHPLYPLLIKPLALVFDPILAGRLISIASGLLAMFVLTRIAATVYGDRAAGVMSWIYLASPLFFWCNLRVLTESTFQLLFCLSVHLFLGSLNSEKPFAGPAFIFVSGLTGLTRPEGFILLPAVAYILFRQVIYNKRDRILVWSLIALSSWLLYLGWSFATSNSDSYSQIFASNMSEFNWSNAFQRLASYVEVYPYITFYPFFFMAILRISDPARDALPQNVTWRWILFYVHLAFAILLFLHPAWSTRFLLIPISLLLVDASARLASSRAAVKAITIVSCLIFSLGAIYLQRGMFSDFKTSAMAIRKVPENRRVLSDEEAKSNYHLGYPVIPYQANVDLLQPGDLLILHSYNTDLSTEKIHLDERYVYRTLLSTETTIVPLLANTATSEIKFSNSPVALLQRFHRHHFQSVVLMIDQVKHRDIKQ